MPKHVIVGMSGGVDSSIAAHLLKLQGFRVSGLFMKNWDEDDGTEFCTAIRDHADASSVCEALDIPLHTVSFSAEYWDEVFSVFLSEYGKGRTPNPDILCNRQIKFKAFLEYATDLGADFIATGHYAGVTAPDDFGRYHLLKGVDPSKDQSYFLYTLGQMALSKTLFPLGGLHKRDIRQLASDLGLINAEKKDSTGICFIGERRFKDFLQRYLPAQPGKIVTIEGDVLGDHAGLMYYTLGQRSGLGIGGQKQSNGDPWYVLAKDLIGNQLIVGQGHDNPALFSRYLEASSLDWTDGECPPAGCYTAKTRYRQQDQPCHLHVQHPGQIALEFDRPQRAVTPGQSVVLYDGDRCLGGGVIDRSW